MSEHLKIIIINRKIVLTFFTQEEKKIPWENSARFFITLSNTKLNSTIRERKDAAAKAQVEERSTDEIFHSPG